MIADEALWQEFAAESEEHLDAIERVLGAGAADRPAVDRLFRAFHSLKGMSDALGARGMKGLAHRAEDLLGLARAGKVAVAGEPADALLAAVDALRRQRAALLERQADEPAPPALLARLGALAGAAEAPGATPAAAGPAGPPPAAQAVAPPALPLPTDPAVALLGAFASRLAAGAPRLPALLDGRDDAALEEAAALAAGARQLGLHRLAAQAEALADAAGTEAAAPALGVLRRALALLEAEAGEEAGAAALCPAGPAAPRLGPGLAALALRAEALAAGEDAAAQGAEADAAGRAALAAEAARLAAVAAAFGLAGIEADLLLLSDLAARAAEADAAALLAAQGPALAARLRAAAEGGEAALHRAAAPPPAEPAEAGMPAAFAPLLGAEGRARVRAALAAGRVLYRLRLATGLPPPLEEAVAAALAAEGELLTSRTLLEAAPPALEALLAAPADTGPLRRALAGADPAGRAVLELAPLADAPGADAARAAGSGPAAPVTLRVRQDTVDRIIALEAEVRAAALALAEALDEGGAAETLAGLSALAARLSAGAALPGGAGARAGAGLARDLSAATARLRAVLEALARAEGRLAVGMRRLDEAVMELRVVPVGSLLGRLPRVARTVAGAGGKELDVVLEGEDVAIDRSLVELLADPLLHLVRNAVDHGVEPPAAREAAGKPRRATLRIAAARRTGQVRVRVSDDGAGIDRARVLARAVERGLVPAGAAAGMGEAEVHALLFRPGFSTAATLTETSGRGVGLDVVQEAVRRAGGTVEVASTPGQGTSFTLRLPLSAAVQPVLLVEAAGHPYALPAARVEAVLEPGAAAGCPVVDLAGALGLQEQPAEAGTGGPTVLLAAGGRRFGLRVGRVQRRTDLLLRPMHPALAALPALGGVGVLGNGEPVLVLEPDGLAPEPGGPG